MPEDLPAGTNLRIEDGSGRVLWGRTVTVPWPFELSLPPGGYQLVDDRPGRAVVRHPFAVAAGKPADLALE
jgi:hypothetical protein